MRRLSVMLAILAMGPLLMPGAARADDAPPPTILRPVPPRELVVLVGGLGSDARDTTFAGVVEDLRSDPGFEIVRFGADPSHPYDTRGPIEPSARELIAQVRELAPDYGAVHIVTHSMGGVVADRAFANGLSASDGVRTYIALASPSRGSEVSRIANGVVRAAAPEGNVVRALFARLEDPGVAAVEDLARARTPAPIDGLARVDVRFATDPLVLERDSVPAGSALRILLPNDVGDLQGHGAVLRDPRVREIVAETVRAREVPLDRRPPNERRLAAAVAWLDERAVLAALGLLSLVTLLGVRALRRPLWLARLLARPLLSPWPFVG